MVRGDGHSGSCYSDCLSSDQSLATSYDVKIIFFGRSVASMQVITQCRLCVNSAINVDYLASDEASFLRKQE